MLNSFFAFQTHSSERKKGFLVGTVIQEQRLVYFLCHILMAEMFFLQNLPGEISDHCSLIDIVPECNKGESETGALLAAARRRMCCFLILKQKKWKCTPRGERIPQALNSPSSGIKSLSESGVCVYEVSVTIRLEERGFGVSG